MKKYIKLLLLIPLSFLLNIIYIPLACAEETIFSFPSETVFIPIGVGVVLLILGILIVLKSSNIRFRILGTILVFLAIFAWGIVAPGIHYDRVVVTPNKIEQTTGIWFDPTTKGFSYNNVDFVEINKNARRGDRWIIRHQDGTIVTIDPGDLWIKNSEKIIDLLKSYNVQFSTKN